MIDSLKFVQGAVAKKDFVPVLTHFRIKDKVIKGFNGQIALCSPINLDLNITPNAAQLIKAINACEGTIALHVSDKGRLVVKSGKFKTFVDCVAEDTFPEIWPQGECIKLDASLLPALRYLEPFIAEDASRPWACGVLFDGQSAYATNNITLVQYWLGYQFPYRVNIPGPAVRELVRIGKDPTHMFADPNRLTFVFGENMWLSTQLFSTEWPPVDRLFPEQSNQLSFADGFFKVLQDLEPFTDDLNRCYFFGDKVSSSPEPDLAGTTYELEGLPATGIYNVKQLLKLKGLAKTCDFSLYPKPALFYGEKVRGIVCGIRS